MVFGRSRHKTEFQFSFEFRLETKNTQMKHLTFSGAEKFWCKIVKCLTDIIIYKRLFKKRKRSMSSNLLL